MADRTCIVDGCDGPSYCRRMCPAHYQRWRKHGDPLVGGNVVRKVSKRTDLCAVDDCDRNVEAMRYCMTHYHRWKRHGDPLHEPERLTVHERFAAKVAPPDANGCKLWLGGTDDKGYGFFQVQRGQKVPAHRWAYQQEVGPIPDGLELDHLCRITSCVTVQHLEPVTKAENLRREWEARRSA